MGHIDSPPQGIECDADHKRMARKKRDPLEVFEENLADAHQLIELTGALANYRKYRTRRERRHTRGQALGLPKRDRDSSMAWSHLRPSLFSSRVVISIVLSSLRRHFVRSCVRPWQQS